MDGLADVGVPITCEQVIGIVDDFEPNAETRLALRSLPDLPGDLDDPRKFAFGQIRRKATTCAGWNAGKATLRG